LQLPQARIDELLAEAEKWFEESRVRP